jgi:hypothetical protein
VNSICGCGLPAHCCQPAGGVIHADLRVSLALTWPAGFVYSVFFLCASLCYKLSPFQAHWGRWHCTHFLRPACLFTVHMGSGSSPLSCGVFLPLPLLQAFPLVITGRCCCSCQLPCLFTAHVGSGSSFLSCGVFLPLPLSQAFPLLVAGCMPGSHRSLSGPPGLFIYSPGKDSSSVLSAPHPLSCIFIVLIAYYSVSLFFPGWRSVRPEGYADLAQGGLWDYRDTSKLTVSVSFQAIWAQATGGPGALLVSPFNVK